MLTLDGYSVDQLVAIERIEEWIDHGTRDLTLGGYAGSGKTTILQYLWPKFQEASTVVMSPTGKASQVLRSKGLDATTVHRLIYKFKGVREEYDGSETPVFKDEGGWQTRDGERPRKLVCDESSMVNQVMYKDVHDRGVPCLWVGDHGQLKPVGGDPRLMENPQIKLEKIHRQAEGNTILRLAHKVRTGHIPRPFDTSNNVQVQRYKSDDHIMSTVIEEGVDQILVPTNALRHRLNLLFREKMRYTGDLEIGDRLICTFNDYRYMIFNGQMFKVVDIGRSNGKVAYVRVAEETNSGWNPIDAWLPLQLSALGNPDYKSRDKIDGTVLFDYGYCISVHKSQGSEFGNVLLIYKDIPAFDMPRWVYTGVTRAKSHLNIVLC